MSEYLFSRNASTYLVDALGRQVYLLNNKGTRVTTVFDIPVDLGPEEAGDFDATVTTVAKAWKGFPFRLRYVVCDIAVTLTIRAGVASKWQEVKVQRTEVHLDYHTGFVVGGESDPVIYEAVVAHEQGHAQDYLNAWSKDDGIKVLLDSYIGKGNSAGGYKDNIDAQMRVKWEAIVNALKVSEMEVNKREREWYLVHGFKAQHTDWSAANHSSEVFTYEPK